MRTPGYPEPAAWLAQNLKTGDSVGTDESCISVSQFRSMQQMLDQSGIVLKESGDLLDEIWINRPSLPDSAIYEHELKFACTDRKTKIAAINNELEKLGANLQIITTLDDLAWTFNLRGSDVEFNPVFMAYAAISKAETLLFLEDKKLPSELKTKLKTEGIKIKEYRELADFLTNLPVGNRILLDPDRTNQDILKNIPNQNPIIEGLSIPCQLKAIKSEAEIRNIRQAMRKDGMAMVEFLYWLKNNLGKIRIDEYTIAEKLIEFRSKQPDFKGISFFPIVGYKEHGAIVHFHVSEDNALPIEKDGFLLLDRKSVV